MLSIKENKSSLLEIKKSKFISFIFRVDSIEDIYFYLDDLRDKYSDSTHICYAYIIDGNIKVNDDKEPSGTAGMPILNVLKSKDLNHVMCCVVRYFGGIKLGAGGLVRAYTNSCVECLNKCEIINLIKGYKYEITFDYDNLKKIDSMVNNYLLDKKYGEKITYTISLIDESILEELEKYSSIKKIDDCYIEEKSSK